MCHPSYPYSFVVLIIFVVVEIKMYAFLISVPDSEDWQVRIPAVLLRRIRRGTYQTGAGLDVVTKRKICPS
jgi:hypothetical protein